MSNEKLKEIIVTNPSKGGKKKGKKTQGKKTAKAASSAPKKKKASSAPSKKKSSKRRKNPGINWGAAAGQMLGGALAYAVAQPVAHLAGSKIANAKVRGGVRTLLAGGLPAVGGLMLSGMAPSIGAGMLGAAGAMAAAHGLNTVGNLGETPNALLQKAGFLQLGAPSDVFERDGIMWRTREDGVEEALAGIGNTPVMVALDSGDQVQGVLAGTFGDGSQLVKVGDDYMLIPAQGNGVGELVQDFSGAGEVIQDFSGTESSALG